MTPHSPGTPTAYAVSPDSGEHWTAEGAWEVSPGIHRIPLPLPMDGLKAINVYVDHHRRRPGAHRRRLVASEIARDLLDRCLGDLGRGVRRHPPVPGHPHPPRPLHAGAGAREELGVDVALGRGEEPALVALNDLDGLTENPFAALLRTAGAHDLAELWNRGRGDGDGDGLPDPAWWRFPDSWLDGDHEIPLGSQDGPAPSTRWRRPATRRDTSSSPTAPPGCCSPATTCSRRSPRRSASPSRPSRSRWATSWRR